MHAPARAVAHGAVLVGLAGLCAAVVLTESFDAVPSGPVLAADAGDAIVGATAPTSGVLGGRGTSGAADVDTPVVPDDACRAAQDAWNEAARAQVDLDVDHPRDLVDGFTAARDSLARVDPPTEVAQDWDVVRVSLTSIADAVEVVGPDDHAGLVKAIDRAGRTIDTAALAAASEQVTTFLQAGCPQM